MSLDRIVIVGAGIGAVSAAATLREEGFDGELLIVGEEKALPYDRPPLSKEYLTGDQSVSNIALKPAQWYEERSIELVLGTRIDRIDAAAAEIVTETDRRLAYDRLLLTTGGRCRKLPFVDSARILYLRTLADADVIAEKLSPGGHLVILGAGFIGCEVAASARKMGMTVTVLEQASAPLSRVLGFDIGRAIGGIHTDAGVDVRTGEAVHDVREVADGLVVSTDRDTIECSYLLVAAGLVPNTEVALGSGITLGNGIVVDEYSQTSVENIYAAGDVAEHPQISLGGRPMRIEHHDNAVKHAQSAARNMLGKNEVYDDPHWFWSDQYDHNLQSIGLSIDYDDVVVRGSFESRKFSVFYLSEGSIRSVFALDRAKDIIAGRKLMAGRVNVTPAQLADESVELKRLLPRPSRTSVRGTTTSVG